MKQMKAWEVYMDDGRDAFKLYVPAEDKKAVHEYVQGNGEVVLIREAVGLPSAPDWLIDTAKLHQDLKAAGWGTMERDLIIRTLERTTTFARAI